MKKPILREGAAGILLALFISQGSSFAQCSATGSQYSENYSVPASWTISDFVTTGGTTVTNCPSTTDPYNGSVSVSSSKFNFVTACGGRELRGYKTMPAALSNDHWTAEFTFTLNAPPAGGLASNAPGHYLLSLTAGTNPIHNSCAGTGYPNSCGATGYPVTNMDAIWVSLGSSGSAPFDCSSNPTQTSWYFMAQSRNDNGTVNSSSAINLTAATTYYIRLQRTWASTGYIAVYSNASHTSLVGYSCFTIDPNITGLNTIQHGVVEQASQYRILNASISNLKIDNDVTCPVTLTPSFTYPSVVCSGNPITVDGTASTGSPMQEIAAYWSISDCDASGAIVAGSEWAQWVMGQAGVYTFPTPANGGPTIKCGYHSIKLAFQNCGNVWSEISHVIYVDCGPKLSIDEPAPVCKGEELTLNATGNAIEYIWTPGSIISPSITIYPTASSVYTVTAYSSNWCPRTANVNVTVKPDLDLNIATGINDATNGQISFGQADDSWKIRGVPGTLYTTPHASLTNAKVISPYSGTFGTWYSSPNVRWISTTSNGSGAPIELAATDMNMQEQGYYWFEYEFTLPYSFDNLRIEATEAAVDNALVLYINSDALIGGNSHYDYWIAGLYNSNFDSNHNPGTIVTNQTHYNNASTNTLLVRVENGGGGLTGNASYMGLLLNAHIKGECSPGKMLTIHQPEENNIADSKIITPEVVVFPTPNNGLFTVSSAALPIQKIVITDITGHVIKETNNLNTTKATIDIQGEQNGIYLVKTWTAESDKPVIKKVILNK